MGAAASIRKSFSRDSREDSPLPANEKKSESKATEPEHVEAKNNPPDDLLSPEDSQLDDIPHRNASRKNSITKDNNPSTSIAGARRKSQVVKLTSGKHKIVTWFENNEQLQVGDIVRVTFANQDPMEGFVVERLNDENLLVDFGENIKQCHIKQCTLIVKSDELEMGDKVEMKPEDSGLYFIGKVIAINTDCTLDILMDGDDPDDIERRVNPDNVRKLMSKRGLVVGRWRRAFMMIVAINKFGRMLYKERTSIDDLGPELDHFAFENEHLRQDYGAGAAFDD